MVNDGCHAEASVNPSAKARARDLVLCQLGLDKVAAWCGVTPNAVHQMLSRASDAAPFPPARVLDVWLGAYRERVAFDLAILWPPYAEMRPARETMQ